MVSMLETTPSGVAAKDYSALYLPGAIIIAGLCIAVGLFFGLSRTGASQAATAGTPQKVDVKDVKLDGEPYIGQKDAPLTMAFWSDYQCPFCKAVEVGGVPQIPVEPSIPAIVKNYVDTGKLRIVFKDYAFLGNDSVTAAEYGRAIWDLYPEKYFEWRTKMYQAQDEEGDQGFGDAASIDALIKKIPGFDDAKIKAQITAKKAQYDAAIAADQQEGASFGIQGTPGFIVGTKSIDGAQAPAVFTAAIESQLK